MLQNDSDFYVIRKGSRNYTVGRLITFNPNETLGGLNEDGSRRRPAFIGLAHELAHALDWDDGKVDEAPWFQIGNEIITNAEKFASHVENMVRAENGIPLREYQAVENGRGVGRLIVEGTRINATDLIWQINGISIPIVYPEN